MLKLSVYGATDRGLSRPYNEDALLMDETLGLYAVADGIGGLAHGDVASKMAIQELHAYFKQRKPGELIDWSALFNHITQVVYQSGRFHGIPLGMGTTLTVMLIEDGHVQWAHVGDSMLFLFRMGEPVYKLTKDHTVGQELLDRTPATDDVYIPEVYMHSLTRCIGQSDFLAVDTGTFKLEVGERLLLCTDGVLLGWQLIQLYQAAFEVKRPEVFVKKIVKICNAAGGHDNVTAIALFVNAE